MADEAFTLIAAGGETTARIICLALFYVLADKDSIMPHLMEELVSVMPEKTMNPRLKDLENLSWLVGTVIRGKTRGCDAKHMLIGLRQEL